METEIKKVNWKVIAVGLVCLTAIEICALLKGIDGSMLMLVIGIIGLAIGVAIPNSLKP